MASLQLEQMVDVVRSSLNDLGEGKITDVMSTYQKTIFMKRLFKQNKVDFQAGPEAEFNLITSTNGSARGVAPYFTANVNPTNVLSKGKIDWRMFTYNFAVDLSEDLVNRSPRQIVNLLKTRRAAALGDAVLYCEKRGWNYALSTNTVDFHGIPYWVVKNTTATTTNDGFNGTTPTGYTTVGNITPSDLTPKWNNYTDTYVTVDRDDFVTKLIRASDYTDFSPLVEDSIPDYNTGDDYSYYCGYATRDSLKSILEGQNDSLGFDLDPTNGKLAFRRAPVTWVKQLDLDTDSPFYLINWGVMGIAGLRGMWMKEISFDKHPNQPTVMAVHYVTKCQSICYDRRRNGVLATAASYDPGS